MKTIRLRGVACLAGLLLSACSSIPPSAYKESGGCRIDRYNPAWVAQNVTGMTWEGPCISGLASGYGKLMVTRRDNVPETYQGSMLHGTFNTVGQAPGLTSEFVSGKYRWVGLFSNGRFFSGQIYLDGKLDYDGTLHPSGRYATGKNYFSSGTYIDGSYIDRSGGVHYHGQGVQKGIVYSPDHTLLHWLFQEKIYRSEKAWNRAINDERMATERKIRNESMLTNKLDNLFNQLNAQVTSRPGSNDETMAFYSQSRDVAQSKVVLLDKLISKCETSRCDYQGMLQQRRNSEYSTYRARADEYDRAVADRESAARIQEFANALEQVALSSGRIDAARYNQAKAEQEKLHAALSRLTTSGSSVETAGTLTEIYTLMNRQ